LLAAELKNDFFAKLFASWQRGSIENNNPLVKQNIPKKVDIEHVTNDYVNYMKQHLNDRPRNDFDI